MKNIEQMEQTDFPFDNEANIGPITVDNHATFMSNLAVLTSEAN